MNEAEWLTCTDTQRMLIWRQGNNPLMPECPAPPVSDRKLRLFVCACCRRVWHLLTDAPSRQAVEIAERYADGQATREELFKGGEAGTGTCSFLVDPANRVAEDCRFCYGQPLAIQAAMLRDITGNPWRPALCGDCGTPWNRHTHDRCNGSDWDLHTVLALARAAYDERPGRKCEACLDWRVSYQPGRPEGRMVRRDQSKKCRICHGAGRVEDGSLDPDTLKILADALEEAGCQSEDMLKHLHSSGPHVRGCWALDMLLGKE